jgi:hypothetical protein
MQFDMLLLQDHPTTESRRLTDTIAPRFGHARAVANEKQRIGSAETLAHMGNRQSVARSVRQYGSPFGTLCSLLCCKNVA